MVYGSDGSQGSCSRRESDIPDLYKLLTASHNAMVLCGADAIGVLTKIDVIAHPSVRA